MKSDNKVRCASAARKIVKYAERGAEMLYNRENINLRVELINLRVEMN